MVAPPSGFEASFFFFLSFLGLALVSWNSLVGSCDSFSAPGGFDEEEDEEEEVEKGLKFLPILLEPIRRKGSLVGADDDSSTSLSGSADSVESKSRDPELWNLVEPSNGVEGVRRYL